MSGVHHWTWGGGGIRLTRRLLQSATQVELVTQLQVDKVRNRTLKRLHFVVRTYIHMYVCMYIRRALSADVGWSDVIQVCSHWPERFTTLQL